MAAWIGVLLGFFVCFYLTDGVTWMQNESMAGDEWRDLLVGLVLVLPFLLWHFRALRSKEVGALMPAGVGGARKRRTLSPADS